ncbi:MAG: methyltransferase [Clostridiales bacterium]|nr:methyltransferase [Clostridiales bacterium]
MNDHYYSADPQSSHRYAPAEYAYRGAALRFLTDAGVFSRGEVDFGTDVLLNALPEDIAGRVLDLGCGWGAVGVSVGKRYPDCRIVMTDVNARAAALAAENARNNGVKAETVTGDGLENVTGAFDYILTNPPIRAGKQVIYALFAACAERLTAAGEMYLVIRKQQGAESAVRYLKTLFCAVDTIDRSGGFHVIRCREAKGNDV